MNSEEMQTEALDRAKHGQSLTNYPAIIRGFMAKGIDESDSRPRVNVFTYRAWLKLERQVRKGERGVRILTYIRGEKTETDGTKTPWSRPHGATVFHVDQTDPVVPDKAWCKLRVTGTA